MSGRRLFQGPLRRLRTARQGALTPIDFVDRTDVDSEALFDDLARDMMSHGHEGSASPQLTVPAASGELLEVRRRSVPDSARPS